MKTEDFDYELDKSLIREAPLKQRDSSRLLVLDKITGAVEHNMFSDIYNVLNKGDVLVLNDTKVLPARLVGEKQDTGAIIEVLLLKNLEDNIWECLIKPLKRVKVGIIIKFGEKLKCEIIEILDEGRVNLKLIYNGILMEILEELGTMPLPPYITKQLDDKDRYQTVYAKKLGSAAAPTAGLHFTNELLDKLEAKGVIITYVTLHVGLGTFRPVTVEDVEEHNMHEEYYEINEETANILNKAKQNKNQIISVGTTTIRVLETNYHEFNEFKATSGWTNIFIYPGFEFLAIDGLITNFHLPKSTLMMLVSALATKEHILNAYNIATKKRYHFFSFGDAMLIK